MRTSPGWENAGSSSVAREAVLHREPSVWRPICASCCSEAPVQTLEQRADGRGQGADLPSVNIAVFSWTPGPYHGSLPPPPQQSQVLKISCQSHSSSCKPNSFSRDPSLAPQTLTASSFQGGSIYTASQHLIPDTSDGTSTVPPPGSLCQWAVCRGACQTPISLTAAPPARGSAWPQHAVARLGP